jgi:hypothetical protein
MQQLAREFTEGNYRYTQVMRQGMRAIYAQHHQHAPVTRYEVVTIRIIPETVWPDGHVTPVHEGYPGSRAWGTHGFTCYTLREAETLLASLPRLGETA